LLKQLVEQEQLALILISHDLAVVNGIADNIIIMRNGDIVERGDLKQLFAHSQHPYTRQLIEASSHQPERVDAADDAQALLQVDKVSCDYQLPRTSLFRAPKYFRAVNSVSFTIKRGESVGLVGESGCGKSTLTRALLGLMPIAAGEVSLNGEQLSSERSHAVKRDMQVVFQDPYGSFNPRHKVKRLVAEPFHVLAQAPTKNVQSDAVAQALVSVGLQESDADKYIHEFSGGQRQRIAIARALILKPALIVLDEAVSALDVSVRAQILDLLSELAASHDIAYLFISHDLSVVRKVTDRVLVMQQGKIVERGQTDACFIDGNWIKPAAGETLALCNPSTGKALCEIARGRQADVDNAVSAAQAALESEWGLTTALQRGRCLAALGRLVEKHTDDLAKLEAQDVGKPLSQARADAVALARYCEFYAGAADKIHGETLPYLNGYTVYTLRQPHGVTGHIVPWNYPMQIIGRSVGAALTMGNAVVLKPAEQACLTALAFAELAQQAGFPAGAINVVPGLGAEAGAALAAHTGVQHLSFTGSVQTGMSVQQAAAQNVIPVTLELGGKSAQLVFDDADIEAALPFLINSGIQNAGQTCSAASRILVHRSVYQTVVDKMAKKYQQLDVGDATSDLALGPLISEQQKQRVQSYIDKASDLNCVARGQIDSSASNNGYFVEPMLFADVPPDHVLAQQEVFGPVQVVMPFDTEEQALTIANGTEFGLVAAIWTRDGGRQMRLAKKLKAGQVFINNYGAGGGVELPFGGVGKSGHGREKGFEALYGMSALKTVAAKHD